MKSMERNNEKRGKKFTRGKKEMKLKKKKQAHFIRRLFLFLL